MVFVIYFQILYSKKYILYFENSDLYYDMNLNDFVVLNLVVISTDL